LYHLTSKKPEKLLKKLLGDKDIEAVLQRLDRLTLDEARITATQTLEIIYDLIRNMRVVMDGEQFIRLVAHWVLRILPSRRQGIGRPLKGYPWYIFQATSDFVSDKPLEIVQQLASDLNKSRRQSFF
jgi:hypothetical protein